MTHSYVWHDSFIYEWHDWLDTKSSSKCEQMKILKSQLATKFKMKMLLTFERFDWSTKMRAAFTRVTWLIHMCDMTHSHVCHDSFTSVTCVAWLIHLRDMTGSFVWRDDLLVREKARVWEDDLSKSSAPFGTKVYIHTHMCTYICVCIYTYMYIYIHTHKYI